MPSRPLSGANMKKKISFQFSPTPISTRDEPRDDESDPTREEEEDDENEKGEGERDYDEERTNTWIRAKVAESLDNVADTSPDLKKPKDADANADANAADDDDADADADADDDPVVEYTDLLNFYFQWKSLYEKECREMKIAVYDDIINKRSSSSQASSSSSSRKMNQGERSLYTQQIKNFQCPCLRCGAHEGMYFKKELFRKGRTPPPPPPKPKEEHPDPDLDRDNKKRASRPPPTPKKTPKRNSSHPSSNKTKPKTTDADADADADTDDEMNDEMNDDLAAMYDRTFQWPNTYIYKAGCSNKKKPCFQVELYSGELATFHDLHMEKAKEHAQIQHDIVVLKLDTIFQYLKSNHCLALFAKKKQAYEGIHVTYEGCQSTVEHLLDKDKDALKQIQKNIAAFHGEWSEYMDKFRESKYQTMRDFEHAIHVERILHQEYDQYAHTKCRERNMQTDSEGMMRLVNIPASRPPKHCVLHGDAPKILHSYIKRDPAPTQ